MIAGELGSDTINPNAPAALASFSFLIGEWDCAARLLDPDGNSQTYRARWIGRFILDGYAIADEYRMYDASDNVIVLGMNLRTYDESSKVWNLKWLNALSGEWTDLAPKELGGPKFDQDSISYHFPEPVAAHAYTRAKYTNIADGHFTWVGEKSDDGDSWTDFMVVECDRVRG